MTGTGRWSLSLLLFLSLLPQRADFHCVNAPARGNWVRDGLYVPEQFLCGRESLRFGAQALWKQFLEGEERVIEKFWGQWCDVIAQCLTCDPYTSNSQVIFNKTIKILWDRWLWKLVSNRVYTQICTWVWAYLGAETGNHMAKMASSLLISIPWPCIHLKGYFWSSLVGR